MTFREALKILNIEEYGDRIINSNSHGELFHLILYINLADGLKEELKENPNWFRDVFIKNVEFAEKNWKRPESVFQHIDKMF